MKSILTEYQRSLRFTPAVAETPAAVRFVYSAKALDKKAKNVPCEASAFVADICE